MGTVLADTFSDQKRCQREPSPLAIPGILKEDGYPDTQAFMRTYNKATELVEQYNRDLAAWERKVKGEEKPAPKPPEKESIRKKLRDMKAEAKRRNDARRLQPCPRTHDYDRGR